MKNDQYFKHDATAAHSFKLTLLLQSEGARGYGIYWLLVETLRMQSNFRLPLCMLEAVARKCHTRLSVVLRVVHNYELFVVEEKYLYSPGLDKRLRNFVKSSGASAEQSERFQNDKPQSVSEKTVLCAPIEEKKREEKKRNCNSSKEKPATATVVLSSSDSDPVLSPLPRPGWEALVNEMEADQSWMELTGMHSGLGELFLKNRHRVVTLFKEHVRLYAKESGLLWLRDVKQYFANYMASGSRTCGLLRDRLLEEAKECCGVAQVSRYETLVDGQRMYLGYLIPSDAPPRPNATAVWVEEVGRWER